MANLGPHVSGVALTSFAVVGAPAAAVEAPLGATPRGVGPAEPLPVSLHGRGRGFLVRGSDRGASRASRAPTSVRPRQQQPHRAFTPRMCELCLGSRTFRSRNAYNTHLKAAHNDVAYHHAETDRLVFRDRRSAGQAQPQGGQAGRGGVSPRPVPTSGAVPPTAPSASLASALREAAAWLQAQASLEPRPLAPAVPVGVRPPSHTVVPPRGRGRGLLDLPATTPTRRWALPTAVHPDPQGGATAVRSISPPRRGPPTSAEELEAVVSELEARLRLRGTPGFLATLPPPQSSRPDQSAELQGQATAPPEPADSKPLLLPGNIVTATRPFWQGMPGDEHQVIPVLLASYRTDMSAAAIQSTLDWMRYQRADMARYLCEWVSTWRQNNYFAEATLNMLTAMLRNMQR